MAILIVTNLKTYDKSFSISKSRTQGLNWLKEYCDGFAIEPKNEVVGEYIAQNTEVRVELLLTTREINGLFA
jgi:hypothetical protein